MDLDISQVNSIRHLYKYHHSTRELKNYYSYTRARKFLSKYYDQVKDKRNLIFIKKNYRIHVFNLQNGIWNGFIMRRFGNLFGTEYLFKPASDFLISQDNFIAIAYVIMMFREHKFDYDKFTVYPEGFDFKKYYNMTGVKFIVPKSEEDKVLY